MSRDEDVFAEARELPAAARAGYLDRACADDPALRARIEELLVGYAEAERAMPRAIVSLVPTLLGEMPSERFGRYKLLEKIGEGGCGVVYLAEQEEPVRRRVALKAIKLGMDTRAVIARFEAERQALALMDHPNIARVYDAGATENGRPFFVMELVRGVAITNYCDKEHLPPQARLELFLAVCAAIQHAHQKGIIHRDIKPSNILVTISDGVAVPKVIDFGIAKATQGRLTDQTLFTAFEQFIGTPVYMSPEQAELSTAEVDPRSDVYSLGVLLYELLTGQPPFDAKAFAQSGVVEIRRQIREVEPTKPSTRWRTLTGAEQSSAANRRGIAPAALSVLLRGDLDWIVMRCLEKDRARRYESVSALTADLQRHLRHEPVVARPPGAFYVLGKFVRRHRVAVAATAAVAGALAVGAAVTAASFVWWRRSAALPPAAVAPPAPTPPQSGAQALSDRAVALINQIIYTRDELAAAEDMARRATVLEPGSAAAWGALAEVQATFINRTWDRSAKRQQDTELSARRALALDPNEPRALVALTRILPAKEAEPLARQALRVAPNDRLALLTLASTVSSRDERRSILKEMIARDPSDGLPHYEMALSYAYASPTPADLAAALQQLDAALAGHPWGSALHLKALFLLGWKGDLAGMRSVVAEIDKLPLFERTEDQPLFLTMWSALLDHEPQRAINAAELTTRSYFEHVAIASPKAWLTALAYTFAGSTSRAQVEWEAAESVLRERLRENPKAHREQAQLAVTLARLGRTGEAAALAAPLDRIAQESRELALNIELARYFATLRDGAHATLYLRRTLNVGPRLTNYTLPLDPWWAPLHGEPAFEALLAEARAHAEKSDFSVL